MAVFGWQRVKTKDTGRTKKYIYLFLSACKVYQYFLHSLTTTCKERGNGALVTVRVEYPSNTTSKADAKTAMQAKKKRCITKYNKTQARGFYIVVQVKQEENKYCAVSFLFLTCVRMLVSRSDSIAKFRAVRGFRNLHTANVSERHTRQIFYYSLLKPK